MRLILKNCIFFLLAVLTIGTAFGDSKSTGIDCICKVDPFLTCMKTAIVPEYADSELKKVQVYSYPQVVAARNALNRYSEQLIRNGEQAKETLSAAYQRFHKDTGAVAVKADVQLDWKMVGTLLLTYQKRIVDVLRNNLIYQTEQKDGVTYLCVGFAPFDDLLWLDSETEWFAARNSYYYLNTIYEDDGSERRLVGYMMPGEKLSGLAFPLDAKWYQRIKTTWLRARDRGLRRHTGMDIRCAHGSPVYACAGGVVNSVGYHVKGGCYVSIVDNDGFEYFYYHLKRNSQCVVRGQRVETGERIGLSGNTGNSAAPHLHLSVITPERRFIDPFQIYYRWVYQKTGMLVKKPR